MEPARMPQSVFQSFGACLLGWLVTSIQAYSPPAEWADSYVEKGGDTVLDVPTEVELGSTSVIEVLALMDPEKLSSGMREALEAFKSPGSKPAILFKKTRSGRIGEWAMGSIAKVLGTPVGFEEVNISELFTQITSANTLSDDDKGPGEDVKHKADRARMRRDFGWRTSALVHPNMPRYTMQMCMRQDSEQPVQTLLLSAQCIAERMADSGPMQVQNLDVLQDRQKYKLKVDPAFDFDKLGLSHPERIPILEDMGHTWRVNIDQWATRPAPGDEEAAFALQDFLDVAEECFVSVQLEEGDILLWDNLRLAHSRQPRLRSTSTIWLHQLHVWSGPVSPFKNYTEAQQSKLDFMEPMPPTFSPNVLRTRGKFEGFVVDPDETPKAATNPGHLEL